MRTLAAALLAVLALPVHAGDSPAEAAQSIAQLWKLRGKTDDSSLKDTRDAAVRASAALTSIYPNLLNPAGLVFVFPEDTSTKVRDTATKALMVRLTGYGMKNPRLLTHDGKTLFLLVNEADEMCLSPNERMTLGCPGPLEFLLEADEEALKEWRSSGNVPAGTHVLQQQDGTDILLLADAELDSSGIASADFAKEMDGSPALLLTFTDEGALKFEKATGENLGRRLAIVMGRKVLMAPTINSKMSRTVQVTGRFKKEDIDYYLKILNQPRLPCHIKELGCSSGVALKPGEVPWAAEPAETFVDRMIGNNLVHAILEDVLKEREPEAYAAILEAVTVRDKTGK